MAPCTQRQITRNEADPADRRCGSLSPPLIPHSNRMRRYHHIGIPTAERRPDEVYLPHLGMYVSGFDTSAFGIEWMRFDADCSLPELVQTVPHVAFEVDDLEAALEGMHVLIPPNSPSPGIRVAFVEENGAPIEFLQIDRAVARVA